jgi:hypothetical protein
MTENEWLACSDPESMLTFLKGKVSDRKLRLFACACCRRVQELAQFEVLRGAVDMSEQYADGLVGPVQLQEARSRVDLGRQPWQAAVLRDIGGNPFRSVVLDPSWLTVPVLSLAQASYDERILPERHLDPVRLGILADALEEAGCTDADILNHLRQQQEHVRGCWVLDLLTAKE